MDIKKIEELMDLMERRGMHRLRIREKDSEVDIERESPFIPNRDFMIAAGGALPVRGTDIPPSLASPKGHIHHEEAAAITINSPMVGTFYLAPSTDAPSFVKVGDLVTPDTVVCIVEAMKVMNEVKAGVSGTIAEVLVDNGHPVEFGSKLFRVV